MSFDTELGPVNYIVATFPSNPIPTGGLSEVLRLVSDGHIAVLDAEFVIRDADGALHTVAADEVGATDFVGASANLIDADDLAVVGEQLTDGGVGVVLVYEELGIRSVLAAWAAEGATVVSEGPIDVVDLVTAIDQSES